MARLVFGKYEKIRRLAQGGMGDVFLARQSGPVGFDRLAILKALKEDLSQDPAFREQFLDEARVAAMLNHPNIVALYDVGEWDGSLYIAMEYIAGDDLSKLWYAAAKKGVGLPFQVSARIVHDACLGLDHAHHAADLEGRPLQIVHRDVSPQNIMVRADGVTKVVDFGIAKAANRVTRTRAGTVKGKLQYMSPEQVKGEPLDGRSDQFSLGIVLWELCTGKRLFKADSELETLNKILQSPIPPPSTLVSGFPDELERVILRMLERERDKRYPRLAAAAKELQAWLERAAKAGEVAVAEFVDGILGEELRARTKDLTPDRSDPEGAPVDDPVAPAPSAREAQPAPAAPREAPKATSTVLVKRADGTVLEFQDAARLHQWILDGHLEERDLLASDGERFTPLGERAELSKFFELARAMQQVSSRLAAEPASQGAAGPAPPLAATTPGWGQIAPPPAVSQPMPRARLATPISAPEAWQLGALSPAPAEPTRLGGVVLVTPVDTGEASPAPGRGGLRWLLAGAAASLLFAAGGLYALDRPLFERIVSSFSEERAAPLDVGALLESVRRADAEGLQTQARALEPQVTSGVRQALAASALLSVERARAAASEARLLRALDEEPARVQALEAEAARQRLAAYRLASAASAKGAGGGLGRLAMAAYQAEGGALVEMRADLAAAERLLSTGPEAPSGAALLAEARAIAALGAAQAALSLEDGAAPEDGAALEDGAVALAEVTTALEASPADRRLALARLALRARLWAGGAEDGSLLADARRFHAEAPSWPQGALLVRLVERGRRARAEPAPRAQEGEAPAPRAQEAEAPAPRFDEVFAAAEKARRAGRCFEAAPLYRGALALDGRSARAHAGYGWCHLDLGYFDAAVQSFERATRLDRRLAEAQFGLAEALRFSGDERGAVEAYRRYLDRFPAGADADVARNALNALE